jgi:His Kinase A (phospho-acceptor) domain/Histidine kinase-, DNA gyrase B-, and HSP90-like ATPase
MLASEALREAQAELAHVNRVTTMGQLAASIAHELNQPLAASVTNACAGLRWLGLQPPNLEEVREALAAIVTDSNRASHVINRMRALIKKAPPRKDGLQINEVILEVTALTRGELVKSGVSLQTQLAQGLPLIQGDRVQLQQVLLNLIMNAVEAMGSVNHGSRELLIGTGANESGGVRISVQDSGPGLNSQVFDRLFDPFYTTKADGMGMVMRGSPGATASASLRLFVLRRRRPFSSAAIARWQRPIANKIVLRCRSSHRTLIRVDDFASGGEPHAFALLHVGDGALQVFDAQGLADDHRMQRNAHDPRLLAAVGV